MSEEAQMTDDESGVSPGLSQAGPSPAPKRMSEQDYQLREQQIDALAAQLEAVILDEAPTWEECFWGQIGQAAGVSDAAHVAARWFLMSRDT